MIKAAGQAEQLLEDLCLDSIPVDPKEVCDAMSCESFSVGFNEKTLQTKGVEGVSVGGPNGAQILVNQSIKNEHRRRFTAAHELGHVCLHLQTGIASEFECTKSDIAGNGSNNRQYEREANDFASALLMPSKYLTPILNKHDLSWKLISRIRKEFNVSLIAAARRAVTLSKEQCCLLVHKDRNMWTPVKSASFQLYIPSGIYPAHLHFKEDSGQQNGLPESLGECCFDDWGIDDHKAKGDIFFSSIHNEEFARTMTLVLFEESDEEDEDEDCSEQPTF